jgi:acetyltransferase-like isoleucine patch superfamily enzyme
VTRAGLPEWDLPLPVPGNIEIGEGSQIWSAWAFAHYRSTRPCGLRMGRNSALWNMSMLDLGPAGELTIGDFSTLLDVTVATNGRVSVGDYSMVGHRVVLAGGPAPVPPEPGAEQPESAAIEIGSNCWVTAGSVILSGARIGDDAIVGAGAVIDGEVPAGATAIGNPYRIVRRSGRR